MPSKKSAKVTSKKIPAKKLTKAEIEAKLVKWKNAYYNAKPLVSDATYDKLEDELRNRFPKSKILLLVGAPIKDKKRKTKLPHYMGSLDKLRPDGSTAKWLGAKPGKVTISAKGDGVSCMLKKINGVVYAYTRGDGETGTDITALIPHIKGMKGKLKEGQAVRGEIMMANTVFAKKYAKKFANTRNLVSGVINAKSPDVNVAKDCEFVVHSQISPHLPLHKAAAPLAKAGFHIIDHKVLTLAKPDEAKLLSALHEARANSKHELDGLVIQKHSNEDIRAFKSNQEGVEAIVDHIEWQKPSRYGVLTPVIILKEKVALTGTKVGRITGHNAKMMHDDKIGPGAKITVTRSGDTIPSVVSVIKGAKPNMPPEGSYEWDDKGTNILVKKGSTDAGHSASMSARALENFLVKAGVENVKATMLEKLTRTGIDTIDKLLKASPTTLKAAGFGPKQVQTLQSQLALKTKTLNEPDLMAGSNIFPAGWGTRLFKTVLADVPMAKLRFMGKSDMLEAVAAIHGMGSKRAMQFALAFPKYIEFENTTGLKASKTKASSAKLKGKVFTVSGFRDKGLAARIEDAGGQFSDSFTSKTTHVIFRSAGSMNGTKFDKAKAKGVMCITLDKLNSMLGS